MSAEFVSASALFADLHPRLETPARDALAQFVARCDEGGHPWSVAELMFLYALGIAGTTAVATRQGRGTTTDLLAYINDEMQASFLMFVDAEADGDDEPGPRPTAEAIAAGDLDAEVRFYYEVVAVALDAVHRELDGVAPDRGDTWTALGRAVDRGYDGWAALVARHADFDAPPDDKVQLLTSCALVMVLQVMARLAPDAAPESEAELGSELGAERRAGAAMAEAAADIPGWAARLAS